jgi:hypothetical protein
VDVRSDGGLKSNRVGLPETGRFSFRSGGEGTYGDAAFQGTKGLGEAFPLTLRTSLSFLRCRSMVAGLMVLSFPAISGVMVKVGH